MTMQKKHYVKIAEIIDTVKKNRLHFEECGDNKPYESENEICLLLKVYFKEENPKFDEDKFSKLCGVEE